MSLIHIPTQVPEIVVYGIALFSAAFIAGFGAACGARVFNKLFS